MFLKQLPTFPPISNWSKFSVTFLRRNLYWISLTSSWTIFRKWYLPGISSHSMKLLEDLLNNEIFQNPLNLKNIMSSSNTIPFIETNNKNESCLPKFTNGYKKVCFRQWEVTIFFSAEPNKIIMGITNKCIWRRDLL